MAESTGVTDAASMTRSRKDSDFRLAGVPWWLLILFLVIVWVFYFVLTDVNYSEAYRFIIDGIAITVRVTIIAYALALVFGCLAGLGRVSRNIVLNNVATFYVEVIRGIPILVLIFYIAFVGIPSAADAIENVIGIELAANSVPMEWRAIIALAITYGAYLAEIFRAGIQSIGRGQMEAARSVGMSYAQAMRYIILPQAIRNVLPALGNDFVAMLKDSSLVSVLAVRDITQSARIYAGSSFRFREAYSVLAVLYLTMTVLLSLVVQFIERRMRTSE